MEQMQGPHTSHPEQTSDVSPDTSAVPSTSALDRAIAAAGLTPSQVAYELRLRPETVWRWRRGASVPTGRHLVALARVLDLEPAAVLSLFPQETR